MNLAAELEQRQRENRAIRVGLVGVGQMGAGMIAQIHLMRGMDVVAAADIDLKRAVGAFRSIGIAEDDIVILGEGATVYDANEAIARGKRVVTSDAINIPEMKVDAVVEATGMPSIGAWVAFRTILAKRHIIMLNVETD